MIENQDRKTLEEKDIILQTRRVTNIIKAIVSQRQSSAKSLAGVRKVPSQAAPSSTKGFAEVNVIKR